MLVALSSVALAAALDASDEDAWPLTAPAPAVAFTPDRVKGLEGYSCATCHAEVTEEWAASAHGLAWIDEAYQDSLKSKRRPQSCHGCHIPEPLLAGELPRRPKPRKTDRHLGIGCEACHLGPNGEILGPHGTKVDAHASRVSDLMSSPGSDALCLACHGTNIGPVIGVGKDFVAREMSKRGRSCVGCHMASVERKWAEGDGVALRTGRSHALQTPRDPGFLRRAIDVAWRTDDGRNRVVLSNRAGHRVPGLIGRELRMRAELLDASGSVIETAELTIDVRAYLPADGTTELRFEESGASVRLIGDHLDPRSDVLTRFLDEHLTETD